jgi:hypothetical protein
MYSFDNDSTKGFTPLEPTHDIGILFDQLLENPATKPIGIKHMPIIREFLIHLFIWLVGHSILAKYINLFKIINNSLFSLNRINFTL